MHSFILKKKPHSFNANRGKKKDNYIAHIRGSFKSFYSEHTRLNGDLYGSLYYFYKKDLGLDTDNLSKPIWDSLSDFLYQDDKQIKLRIAGSFDISKNDFKILDISGLPGNLLTALLDAFDTEDHIVYIECGILHHSMYKFNLVFNGN